MPVAIVDGQARFGKTLEAFYRDPDLVVGIARRGILIPPTADVAADAEPALAYVNPLPDGSARWIADCPDCAARGRISAEYVWLKTPLLFCTRCANVGIGGRWRPVAVPKNRAAIEQALVARPDPETRAWGPGMSVKDLRAQNRALGIGG